MSYSTNQLFVGALAVSGLDKEDAQTQKKAKAMFEFTLQMAASIYIQQAAIALCEAGEIDAVPVINQAMKKFRLEIV